ncbi:EAL domain-containing protein, partial [Lichenihabitans sp. Uapishka_5]|uniref:EAL domain-containing protein n=1 Tax=Lichenihabitans sp. Uapishka_5 TaxID=3037302 RepID=UPI0029E8089B
RRPLHAVGEPMPLRQGQRQATMLKVLNCVAQEHDLRLVALSAVICVLGCFTTVTLLGRAQVDSRRFVPWTFAAATLFGCSIWSLHFVSMLAFMPGLPIVYEIGLTAASIAVPVGGAWAAFQLLRLRAPRPVVVALCGSVLGLAIAGMHYCGVAAMRVPGLLLFDRAAVAASCAWSLAFAILALARSRDLARLGCRLEVAAWLTIGICGLHFTGMSAVTIVPGPIGDVPATVLGGAALALAVGGVSLVILLASLIAVMLEQHLAQRAMQELDRMRLLANLSHEVLILQRDGVVLEVNSAGERLFRQDASDLIGRSVMSLFATGSVPALCRRMTLPALERKPEEVEVQTLAGTNVTVELSCEPLMYRGQPATAMALRDLTDRKRDEARIRHLARHDALTGLPNRYTLQERLEIALETADRDRSGVAVVYLDFDRFKPVNDLFGHAVGDALLVRATRRIQAELGATDMLARIGGDEFVIVLAGVAHPEKAGDTAQRVIEALSKPFLIEGHHIEIGVSAGIALHPVDGDTPDTLLRAADTAMYRVKDEGRGALRFFEPAMDAQLQARRQLEQELGGAIAAGELMLHYQPIVNGASGDVETLEALIRWNHPVRGLVPPNDFIPFSEETGLIGRIGAWVIDTACAAAVRWPQPWRVSVNVSPMQFRLDDVCATVASALERHGLAPGRLVIEITEGVLMADAVKAVAVLNRLRDLGVRIALDDFGTGFSSLSYLQLFRFDKFKIDKSFIRKLGQSDEALTLTRTIVNLGHNLGLQVTAEGVETAEQLAILQALGCDQIQGFLVARPAPVSSFGETDRIRARALFQGPPALLSA